MAASVSELLEVHRRERKELQGKIQEMKHGIPKGDKRKKKETTAEIAILEAEMAARHEREIKEMKTFSNCEKDENCQDVSELSNCVAVDEPPKRISKAEKRRKKKADKAKEREEAIIQQEIENISGIRNMELTKINKMLEERGLSIHEVPSDGDCLYKSIEHQLSALNLQETTVKQLRQKTSDYMLSHREDFIPFLTDSVTGDVMTEDQYDNYCKDIANKSPWGGQVEIQAMSNVYGVSIEVIQAEGPSVITGENKVPSKLILSYHRHMYGLGEHYNSVIKKVDIDES